MTYTQTLQDFSCSNLRSLDLSEMQSVAGGLQSSIGYSSSLGVAMTMVGGAIAAGAAAPLIAGALALGSIGAAGVAIYWGIRRAQ